jgi:hypothetical protein
VIIAATTHAYSTTESLPTVTRYDCSARLAILEAHGEVSREDAIAQFRAVCTELATVYRRHPEAPFGVLLDTRRATTVPTTEDILRVLDEICGCDAGVLPTRWAMLATEPVHYGMGRLFGSYAEGQGIDLRVFSTLESASDWLRDR